jgi:hypothetical protein
MHTLTVNCLRKPDDTDEERPITTGEALRTQKIQFPLHENLPENDKCSCRVDYVISKLQTL